MNHKDLCSFKQIFLLIINIIICNILISGHFSDNIKCCQCVGPRAYCFIEKGCLEHTREHIRLWAQRYLSLMVAQPPQQPLVVLLIVHIKNHYV